LNFTNIIIGGGPAGISTWLNLNKYSKELASQTILIERSVYPRKKLCGGGISTPGIELLKDLGFKFDFPHQSISKMEIRFGNETHILPSPPGLVIVERSAFDHALAKEALRQGMQLHEAESFIGFERKGDELIVSTDKYTYRTKTLIAADGAKSTVRKKMGLQETSRVSRLLETVSSGNKNASSLARDMISIDFTAKENGLQGYAWRFPCFKGEEPAFNYGIYDSRIYPEKESPSLKETLIRLYGKEFNDAEIEGHPLRYFNKTATCSQPNIILTGDALGVDPALGEGISVSLHYGKIAAHALFLAWKNNDFSFRNYEDIIFMHPLGAALINQYRWARELYNNGELNQVRKYFIK
jgi:flavin-dependent dehydrogenase